MNKRKITLIKAGVKLFAEKGYHKTSVQDIATEAGISKGAFYLSFDSKEAFIGTAIEYFHNELVGKIEGVDDSDISPTELFTKQIDVLTAYMYRYREFIMMLFQEDVSFGPQAEKLFQQAKTNNFYWLKERIEAIYGEQVDRYIFDAVIQLEGLLNGYFQWVVLDDIRIDRQRLGPFIIERLDDLIHGMLSKKGTPLVTKDHVSLTFDLFDKKRPNNEKVQEVLTKMKAAIQQLDLSEEQQSELMEVINMLQSEQQKVVIQGLLAHFEPYASLEKYCEQLATLFQIDLLKE